jgi:hypothetical protein
MSPQADCSQNIDPLKLVREGTSQDGRSSGALDPAYAPVDEHGVAHNMVFAQSYALLLKYFDPAGAQLGDWSPFFGGDVSVLLAVAAIEDMDTHVSNTQSWFNYLNETENKANTSGLKDRLGFLYGSVASLAARLDALAQGLPADVPLKGALQNLIRTQLAPAFKRLIGYYKAAVALGLINDVAPPVRILRRPAVSFHSVFSPASPAETLSEDWSGGLAWATYTAGIAQDASVYGEPLDLFSQINHCSTHTLFKSVFDQFLKVFARVVGEAQTALDDSLTKRNTHQPHHALFFAFLRLLERARSSGNTLTQRHLDFYYRVILGLKEKSARPGHVFLLAELAKQASSRAFKPGELFKAGKDDRGKDAFFANRSDFVANQAKVAALQTLYRHGGESVGSSSLHTGRLFASPVANSDDGLGAPLTSADGSWHPFFNKTYVDGALAEIRMPKAEIGFAIASHYLLMAEGTRWIVAVMTVSGYTGAVLDASWSNIDQVGFGSDDVSCLLTVEKGWLEHQALFFVPASADTFYLVLEIGGGDPAIVPYSAKAHGYSFQTDAPMLLVKLKQDDTRRYAYPAFQNVSVADIALSVYVSGVKSLAASNDFGPLDTSKPFQPFGISPVAGSSLIIGSKEIFQKKLSYAWIALNWLTPPWAFAPTPLPTIGFDFLSAGDWKATGNAAASVAGVTYILTSDLDKPVLDAPDYTPSAPYSTQSRYGFVRLKLSGGFGQDAYQAALIHYMRKDPANAPDPGSKPPTGPTASSLSMGYAAESALVLNTSDKNSYANRPGQFFHLTPFGTAEQHPYLNGKGRVCLFPQFEFGETAGVLASEAEFYIGIAGLAPPQNLSLLFQVADGTANPLALKPAPHIDWSYLKGNEWIEFQANEVQNTTDDLLNSGIVTFAVPRNAANDNTLLQSGLFWIRAAVHQNSDAICRLQLVAAQALEAEFVDRGNSPDYSATPLPAGTISKLDKPDAAVKSITQPFASFGGSSAEQSRAFYTRVSERLRHKNRAIALWDYERLILERFPQIYKVRCLNHTCYEPSESGSGIYRELAPGHVTIVTVPNLQSQNLRDPLKPFTSLGLLEDIKAFLQERTSCFAQLHVKNPQFEEVRVRFSLRLRDGFDETYYANLLRQAITRFLSPWAFAGGGTPSFGGRIYKSVLINFVEEQPYVDYVTDFRVFHDVAGVRGTVDLDEVQGSRAVSILVSAPASKHEIAILKPEQDAPLGELCSCDA